MTVEERVDELEEMILHTNNHNKYASKGQGNAGVALGSVGTALGGVALLGGAGNIIGNLLGRGGGCNGPVTQAEIAMMKTIQDKDMEIAALNTDVKFRDSTIYADQKSLELYKYFDGRFREFETVIANQAVQNQATKDSFQLIQERLDCAKKECCGAIEAEIAARKCADNTIVNYVNATFYPKMVADVTVGTTTTAQTLYNPLPINACGCGCGF